MNKALTYTGFSLGAIFVVVIFVTAKTYTQLAVASLVYIPFAYFAFLIFQKATKKPKLTVKVPSKVQEKVQAQPQIEPEKAKGDENITSQVVDIDKRAFLKLVGATGLSVFLFSIFGRRVETALFGNVLNSGTGTNNVSPTQASPTDGYKISEVDDGETSYYGFTNKDGAWFIMKEDPDSGSFRYAQGKRDFAGSWLNRLDLEYDYFYNLF
jgi:hypothetical protein